MVSLVAVVVVGLLVYPASVATAHSPQQRAITALQNKVRVLESQLQRLVARGGLMTPVIMDSAGTLVGPVTAVLHEAMVETITPIHGRSVQLTVTPTGISGNVGAVLYAAPDCAGQAYVRVERVDPALFLPLAAMGFPGRTLYVSEAGAPFATLTVITPFSHIESHEGRLVCVSHEAGVLSEVVPGTPLLDLDTVWVPPFRVE